MNELQLRSSFVQSLANEKGYTDSSLRADLLLPKNSRVDLVSLNTDDNTITSLFEFELTASNKTLKDAAARLLNYKKLLGGTNVPAYIVTPSDGDEALFNIYAVTDSGETDFIKFNDFPSYISLISSEKALNKSKNKAETKETIDKFKVLCFSMSAIALVLLVLDITDILKLTSGQLSLLAISIALALIPYAAKLKILGIEFERNEPTNKP